MGVFSSGPGSRVARAGPGQGFDNKMFGIAEPEAQAMDPHQRILPLDLQRYGDDGGNVS